MTIRGLHHVGVPVRNMARAESFYVDVLGLVPSEKKRNWLHAGDHFSVHLMHCPDDLGPINATRHFALEVGRLEEIVELLLKRGITPYQLTVDQSRRHDVTTLDDPLDFGIGTLFVEDPDGNTVEFLQVGRGINLEVLGPPQAGARQ